MDRIRWDYLFSYWIYVWFLAYLLLAIFCKGFGKIIDAVINYGNPSLALYIALIENVASFFVLIWFQASTTVLVKYVIMIFFAKGIPIYLLRNYPIRVTYNVGILLIIFLLYLGYLYVNGQDVVEIYRKTFGWVLSNSNKTPFFYLLRGTTFP